MVSNQGWSDERLQPRLRGTHTVKEADMITAKMHLLMKRLDDYTSEKATMATTSLPMDSHMTCEVCGNTGHSGNYCPETQEEVMYMNGNNNGYRPPQQGGQSWNPQRPYYQGGNQGNSYNPNQPSLRDLVFGQAKINEGINKKLAALDKAVKSLNVKLDSFSSAQKSQLSFNKMLETQLAQLAALVPSADNERFPGQPLSSCENVGVVSTRWGKPPRKTHAPNYAAHITNSRSMGGINSCAQERSWLSGYYMHHLLPDDQACPL